MFVCPYEKSFIFFLHRCTHIVFVQNEQYASLLHTTYTLPQDESKKSEESGWLCQRIELYKIRVFLCGLYGPKEKTHI